MPCYLSKTSYYDSKPWALQKEAKALNYWISEAKLLNEWKFFFANTSHSIYQNENCEIRLKKRVQRSWVWWRRACPRSTQKTEQEDRRFAVSRTKGRFSDVKRKRRGLSLSKYRLRAVTVSLDVPDQPGLGFHPLSCLRCSDTGQACPCDWRGCSDQLYWPLGNLSCGNSQPVARAIQHWLF